MEVFEKILRKCYKQQHNPVQPVGISNKGNSPEKQRLDFFQTTATNNIDTAENVGLVGATIGVSHIIRRRHNLEKMELSLFFAVNCYFQEGRIRATN